MKLNLAFWIPASAAALGAVTLAVLAAYHHGKRHRIWEEARAV